MTREQFIIGCHRVWLLKIKKRYNDFDCVNALDDRKKRFVEFARPRMSQELLCGVWLIEKEKIVLDTIYPEPKPVEELGAMGDAFTAICKGVEPEIPNKR